MINGRNADNKKRRDFIAKGALMAPVVLTLKSGSAMAAQSISCLAKQSNSTVVPQTIVTSLANDNYIRGAGRLRTLISSLGNVIVYQFPLGSKNWYPVTENSDSDSFYYEGSVAGLMLFSKAKTKRYVYVAARDTDCYILARLDPATGLPTGVVGPNNTQNTIASTQSCMTSLFS